MRLHRFETAVIDDAESAAVWAVAASGERVRLTDGHDRYLASNRGEHILALGGADEVFGGRGDDVIRGGKGSDGGVRDGVPGSLSGAQGQDLIYGQAGDDEIQGNAGRDRLYGGNGADQLDGGNNHDLLCGGMGADEIVCGSGTGPAFSDGTRDTIVYLSAAESTSDAMDLVDYFATGIDKVDLHAIDADVATDADDAFRFIGNAAFSGVAGELRAVMDGFNARLEGDVDGDGAADLVIFFSVVVEKLHAHDFVL